MTEFNPEKINFFARTDARGKNVPFGIKAKDRQRHMYIIGKTGMGKSTLLENMAVQDIQNGEGMAFIDPHGSAAETLLNYIPEHRINDVLYFAPFDAEHPVSFNIMEDVGPDKRHLVVSGLMSVFKKIWVDAWSARMEYILSNTLLALLEYPDSTLLGVNRMLSDKDYRKLIVDNVKDPGVKSFWVDEFAKYNERYMQEAGDAIKNKIGQFTSNPIIRNIIGQPHSSFDIRSMMDEQKILIINLSKGLIGESNANLLGSMLTTRIYLAAMSRADLPPEKMKKMPNFYFYVDEFQSFANATFANILSEARKYHLNLTIAHQYIEQMEEEVRSAVFGNVGTIISFRIGPMDAEILETIFSPQFLATDIVNLSFAQIYLTLMIDGIGSTPFSATTMPPIEKPQISYRDVVVAASRRQFSCPRGEVEALIHKFHEPVVLPKKEREGNREGGGNGNGNGNGNRNNNGAVNNHGNGAYTRREVNNGDRPSVSSAPREFRKEEQHHRGGAPATNHKAPSHESNHRETEREPRPHQNHEQHAPRPHSNGHATHAKQGNGAQSFKEKRPEIVPQKEKKEFDLSELRNVLQKLSVQQGEKKGTDDRVPAAPKVQNNHQGETSETSVQKASEAPVTHVEDGNLRQNTPRATGEVDTCHERRQNTHGDITPKELERMMRVTESDRSPY